MYHSCLFFFFFQAEDGIRDLTVTGVQTCALPISFTRRAAEELRHRLAGLLGPVADDVTVSTFHSLGLAILRENASAAGLPPDFRIAEEAERVAALLEAGRAAPASAARPPPGGAPSTGGGGR